MPWEGQTEWPNKGGPMRAILSAWIVILIAGISLAQSPQGVGTNTTAVIAVNGDLVLLNRTGGILYSDDEGETIDLLYQAPESADVFRGISAAGEVVVVVGTDGLILRSDFAASNTNWVEVASGDILGELRSVATDGAGTWIAVGDGALLSADDALTWDVGEDAPEHLNSIAWNAVGTNWVMVGSDDLGSPMAYTFDGDDDLVEADLPVDMPWVILRAVAADGFGNVLAVGDSGAVILSMDNGATYSLIDVNVSQDLYAVIATGENQWVFGGQERLLLSLSAGVPSTLLTTDPAAGDIQSIVPLPGFYFLAGVDEIISPLPDDAGVFTSITLAGTNIVLVLDDDIAIGVNYQLQETQDLTDPSGWTDEDPPQPGMGVQLQWTLPLKDGLRIYRAVVRE